MFLIWVSQPTHFLAKIFQHMEKKKIDIAEENIYDRVPTTHIGHFSTTKVGTTFNLDVILTIAIESAHTVLTVIVEFRYIKLIN